jgi:cyclic-di-GMP-binding biofilm dispersal mediator protein
MSFNGARILVVGGSGALGAEFVRKFKAVGAEVIASARNADTAQRIPIEADLRLILDLEDQQSISRAVEYLKTAYDHLDGVVLAAGLVAFGATAETTISNFSRLIQVNCIGQIAVASELGELLGKSERDSKFIAGLSGVVAEKTFPGMAAYTASKTAFSAGLRSLQLELRRKGISVLDARPGHTETGLAGRAIFGTAPAFSTGMTATHVVDRVIKAISEQKTELASSDF